MDILEPHVPITQGLIWGEDFIAFSKPVPLNNLAKKFKTI